MNGNNDFENRNNAQRDTSGTTPARKPITNEERRRMEQRRMEVLNGTAQRTAKQDSQSARQNAPARAADGNRAQPIELTSRKRKVKINYGLIIFAVIVIVALVFAVVHIINNRDTGTVPGPFDTEPFPDTSESSDTDETEPSDTGESDTSDTEDTDVPPVAERGFCVTVGNDTVSDGYLILVNYEHEYPYADNNSHVINVRENRKSDIQVSSYNISLDPVIIDSFDAIENELVKMGCTEQLLINSAYRSKADQQATWDYYLENNGLEYTQSYVSVPGFSEHHTGLAADITFYISSSGATIPLRDHDFGQWITDEAENYGLILRYPENKTNITHISYESWHFRYVGIPHAIACTSLGFCLEEYEEYLKNFTADSKLLHVAGTTVEEINHSDATGDFTGWIIYYVPLSSGDQTEIYIPFAENSVEYTLSGNNYDGFIVTVSCSD